MFAQTSRASISARIAADVTAPPLASPDRGERTVPWPVLDTTTR
jgi:hypothetical protein